MKKTFRTLWNAIQDAFDVLGSLILINILWLLFTLPVVTAPGAFAGVYYAAHQLVQREPFDIKFFFTGFKRYFLPGFAWLGVNIIVTGSMGLNYLYLSAMDSTLAIFFRSAVLVVFLFWVLLQFYTFPLMVEQEKPNYITAMRNSVVLFLKWPGFMLIFSILMVVIIALSVWVVVPFAVFTTGWCSFLAAYAVRQKLEEEFAKHPVSTDQNPL